jgi:DNA-binding MarR family transcriptional regulator
MTEQAYRTSLNRVLDASRLTEAQTIVFASVFEAAEKGLPCPTGEELNDLLGFSSDSASRFTLARLEAKGLIKVERHRRHRIVTITATEAKTSSAGRSASPLDAVRGTHDTRPLSKALTEIGIAAERIEKIACDFQTLIRFEKELTRALELITRRKVHFLTAPRASIQSAEQGA